jgi:hypothetical protein
MSGPVGAFGRGTRGGEATAVGTRKSERPGTQWKSSAFQGAGLPGRRERGPRQASWTLLVVGITLLTGAVFLLSWLWADVGTATAYRAGTVCPAGAPVSADCLVRDPATVRSFAFVGSANGSRGGSGIDAIYAVTVTADHAADPAPLRGRLPAGIKSLSAARLAVGSTVQAVIWHGQVVAATSHLGTATTGTTPTEAFYRILTAAVAALIVGTSAVMAGAPRLQRPVDLIGYVMGLGLLTLAVGCCAVAVGGMRFGLIPVTASLAAPMLWFTLRREELRLIRAMGRQQPRYPGRGSAATPEDARPS